MNDIRKKFEVTGTRIDNGELVTGLLITNKLGAYIVIEENPHICNMYGYIEIDEFYQVKPETVHHFKKPSTVTWDLLPEDKKEIKNENTKMS